MTKPLYFYDTYLFESQAKINSYGSDEKGSYITLDQTIFYPQGGGQPSDSGTLILNDFMINIHFIKQFENEIRHYYSNDNLDIIGDLKDEVCTLKIDENKRLLNARYHTCAHLLGNVVESIHPNLKAVKGHSFPDEAYVEFDGVVGIDINTIQNVMNKIISGNVLTKTFEIMPNEFEDKFYKLTYQIPADKTFRVMQIGNYAPIPCGGTHIKNIAEIGDVQIRKISNKNSHTKICYGLN